MQNAHRERSINDGGFIAVRGSKVGVFTNGLNAGSRINKIPGAPTHCTNHVEFCDLRMPARVCDFLSARPIYQHVLVSDSSKAHAVHN